jgi:hypothetical protein
MIVKQLNSYIWPMKYHMPIRDGVGTSPHVSLHIRSKMQDERDPWDLENHCWGILPKRQLQIKVWVGIVI